MSFSFISKISVYLSFIFIISCQDTISSLRINENIVSSDNTFQFETEKFLDFSLFEQNEENVIDNYSYNPSDYNFLNKDLAVLKINNYESKYNNNSPINVIFLEESIYSINKDGDELKVSDDSIEVKEQKTTLEESDMEELIDEYQNVPYDYDDTKH